MLVAIVCTQVCVTPFIIPTSMQTSHYGLQLEDIVNVYSYMRAKCILFNSIKALLAYVS